MTYYAIVTLGPLRQRWSSTFTSTERTFVTSSAPPKKPNETLGWLTDPRIQRISSASIRTIAARILEAGALSVDPSTLRAKHLTATFDIGGILRTNSLPTLALVNETTTRVKHILGAKYDARLSVREHTYLHIHLIEKG